MKRSRKGGMAARSLIVLSAVALMLSGCGPGKGNLSITSDPAGAKVYVNGSDKGTAPVRLPGLVSGEYVIELRKEDYDRAYKSVALLEKQDLEVDLEMQKTTGLLLVDSIPQGVDVVIAGVSKGNTPLLVSDLPLGSYKLEFRSPTHLPRTLSAELVNRKPVHVVADLISNTAKLVVSSDPPGAEIRINGIAVGVTPATIQDVISGESDIKIWKSGYAPFTQRMTLEATRSYRINPELAALPSGLTVTSQPEGAEVVIDNKPIGTTPLTLENLKEGSHQIAVSLAGYETASKNIYLEPDLNDSAEFTLVKNSGSLMLVTEPANVKVYVGGTLRVTTQPKGGTEALSQPEDILLQFGIDHNIQLVREGYVSSTLSVSTELDEVVTRHEILKRIFIYDTQITTDTEIIKCRLEYELPNGTLYYEVRPGIFDSRTKSVIRNVEPITLSDESNLEARRLMEMNKQAVPEER
jgi:hypothetical protein